MRSTTILLLVPRGSLPGTKAEILGMYRQHLIHAKKFPSMKRKAIYEDIRIEWREKAKLTDERAVTQALEIGVRGIDTLRKYTGLDKKSADWRVQLEQDPLGAGEAEARRMAAAAASRPALAAKPTSSPAADFVDAGVTARIGKLE